MTAPLPTSPGPTEDTLLTSSVRARGREQALSVIDWLLSGEGQAAIGAYEVNEQQLFFPNAG